MEMFALKYLHINDIKIQDEQWRHIQANNTTSDLEKDFCQVKITVKKFREAIWKDK